MYKSPYQRYNIKRLEKKGYIEWGSDRPRWLYRFSPPLTYEIKYQ